jgi:hypothetical protein
MRFFARRIVLVIAIVSALSTYIALKQFEWAFDLAVCVAYTLMVLGDGITEQILRGDTLAGQKVTAILLTHVCFLAVVVGVSRLMYYLKSTDESLTMAQRSGRSYYDFVAIGVAVALGLAERVMLFRPNEEKAKEKVTA